MKLRFPWIDTAFWLVLALYIVSFLPSINIPFIIDDLDHLYDLSRAVESGSVFQWIWAPHNEHIVPLGKFLYYISYALFWVHPQFLHGLIIAACALGLALTFALVKELTGSKIAALLSAAFFASTQLPDLSIFVVTNSYVVFCYVLFLCLFYSLEKYARSRARAWLSMIFLSTLLLPFSFALGLLSFPLTLLFVLLVLKDSPPETKKVSLAVCLVSWIISCIPYALAAKTILHSRHYKDVGASGAFESVDIVQSFSYLLMYLKKDLLTQLFPHTWMTFTVWVMAFAAMCAALTRIPWRTIIFFLAVGLLPTSIIFCFRSAWGMENLLFSRYDVFAAYSVATALALIIGAGLENFHSRHPALTRSILSGFIVVFCLFSFPLRYTKARQIATEAHSILQDFNLVFRDTFEGFFHRHPDVPTINVRDAHVPLKTAESLVTKGGVTPYLTRHVRKLSFFGRYLLPPTIREKIEWGQQTSPVLLYHISQQPDKDRYKIILYLLTRGQ